MADSRIHLLLVEDNPTDALLLRVALAEITADRFPLTVVERLAAGLTLLRESAFDVALLDLGLPDSQGLETLIRLREEAPHLAIVVLTVTDDETLALKTLQHGAQDYLIKGQVTGATLARSVRYAIERKKAEEALAQSEERYRSVVEGSLQGIAIQQDGQIRYANPACALMFGYASPAELVGRDCESLVAPEDWPMVRAAGGECLRGELLQPHPGWRGVRKNGTQLWVSSVANPIRWEHRPAVLSFLIDFSERRSLEEQLRQAQKMEAIGKLAGGVAHDFNNMLTIINGYSELLLGGLRQDDPAWEPILQIRRAGDRAASLTRQLLAFSRKQILAPQVLDINAVVTEMEKMLHRLIGEDIDLITALDPVLDNVKADPGQLEQVIMNLVVNARDAMPKGGRLTIESRNVHLDRAYAQAHAEVQPGPYVMLAVRDTGCGMDEATRTHLFEPFFTTKEVGKGTGLGLATVYGIIKQSHGHIEVSSEPRCGTAFRIFLPRFQEMGSSNGPQPSLFPLPPGTETILLAEDEAGVRGLARVMLQSIGYTVLEARDGQEALRIAAAHQEPIHLLVTDVVMPKMSGPQLADLLAPCRPGLKVLYLSGYTDDAIVRHGIQSTNIAFLQKPFTATTLNRKVHEVLNQET